MTKRILVALDADADTPVAIRHAVAIARRHEASLTGLAVIDAGHIDPEAQSDSLSGVYQATAVQKGLTSETQQRAEQIIEQFEEMVRSSGVDFEQRLRQGIPFQGIIEEMKYHDLLVIGETPHFFYNQPQQQTKTLARVVRDAFAPTLIVREEREPPVRRVLFAFDGGESAARTLHAFAQLRPFGTEPPVTLLHVHDDLPEMSDRILKQARTYLGAHGFDADVESVDGTAPQDVIVARAQEIGADAVAAGAHPVSKLRQLTLGSVTASVIEECPASLFVHH